MISHNHTLGTAQHLWNLVEEFSLDNWDENMILSRGPQFGQQLCLLGLSRRPRKTLESFLLPFCLNAMSSRKQNAFFTLPLERVLAPFTFWQFFTRLVRISHANAREKVFASRNQQPLPSREDFAHAFPFKLETVPLHTA